MVPDSRNVAESLEVIMTDQCKHCDARGDFDRCTSLECGHHENWISRQHRERYAKLKAAAQDVCDLYPQDMDDDGSGKVGFNVNARNAVKSLRDMLRS